MAMPLDSVVCDFLFQNLDFDLMHKIVYTKLYQVKHES